MKFIPGIILMMVIALPPVRLDGQKSHYYAPPEALFSVNFPAGYTIAREETDLASTIKAECYADQQYYLASYTILPAELDKRAKMTELTMDFFRDAIDATEVSKRVWSVNGHEGLLACLIMTEEKVTIEYRVIVIDNMLYQLAYIANKDNFTQENAMAFIDSFELYKD